MADAPLPAAGWYADGVTAGVLRWFDGTAWTEQTIPDPAAPVLVVDPWPIEPATTERRVGSTIPARIGEGLSPEDRMARDAAIARHRVGEACRVRRGAIGYFCSGVVVLALTGAVSLAVGGPGDLWYLGAAGGGFCVWRSVRDYQRAVFRGAPRLSRAGWALAGLALAGALVLFASVPVHAVHQVSHVLDGTQVGLPGLP